MLYPRKNSFIRRAAAAVEMAVVAPVLFTLVLGSVELGRAMMAANVLTNAAREGARVAVVPNGANTDVTTAVNNELAASLIPRTNSTIVVQVKGATTDATTAATGDDVSVSVTVPFKDVTWLPTTFFLGNSATITAKAIMRRE